MEADNLMYINTSTVAGVNWPDIQSKTFELLRKISVKFQSNISPQLQSIKYILAIDLSCKLLNLDYNRNNLIKLSGIRESEYIRNINVILTALNIDTNQIPTIDMLSIKFGTTYKTITIDILDRYIKYEYKKGHIIAVDSPRIQAVHQAAAFYVTLKQRKVTQHSHINHIHLYTFTNMLIYYTIYMIYMIDSSG